MTRPARRRWQGDLLAILGALLAGAAFLTVQQLASDLRDANKARDALAQQVQELGGRPVAGPPGSRGSPGESVTGPQGPPGEQGPAGLPGRTGPSGAPGRAGADGTDGTDGEAGTDGISGPTGDTGTAGASGPQGEPGPAGPQGPAGPAGPTGPTGQDGTDGRDGQTCPDGYSLQPPPGDPDALVCRRDGAPAPSDPTPAPSLLGLPADRRRS